MLLGIGIAERALDEPGGPGCDDPGGVFCGASSGEEVIGLREGQKTLGMLGRFVDFPGIVEGHDLVGGGVQNEEVAFQFGDLARLAVQGKIVEEAFSKVEAASGEGDLGMAVGLEVTQAVAKEIDHVGGVGGCADGGHSAALRNLPGGREDGGTTEAVTDEKRGCLVFGAKVVSGGDEIVDVGDEGRVGKLTSAGPEAGEVEAQGGDSLRGQGTRDAHRGSNVFAASEAVGKEGDCVQRTGGEFEAGIEGVALRRWEADLP